MTSQTEIMNLFEEIPFKINRLLLSEYLLIGAAFMCSVQLSYFKGRESDVSFKDLRHLIDVVLLPLFCVLGCVMIIAGTLMKNTKICLTSMFCFIITLVLDILSLVILIKDKQNVFLEVLIFFLVLFPAFMAKQHKTAIEFEVACDKQKQGLLRKETEESKEL